MKLAVLMTCHNRREKTLRCLESLLVCCRDRKLTTDVFLVDDGSTDGTGEAVKEWKTIHCQPPTFNLNLIAGSGNLYWAKGMALAWQTAIDAGARYDHYLWLNDDVVLFEDAIETLLADAQGAHGESVVAGFCRDSKGRCSYGATDSENRLMMPTGNPQKVDGWLTGNVVLVPREVCNEIGIIDRRYTHARADFDYAERLKRSGLPFFASSKYVGVCDNDWAEKMRNKTFGERIALLWSPGYCNLHDLWLIRYQYHGIFRAMISCLHLILMVMRRVK